MKPKESRWLDQSSYKEDAEWAIVAITFPRLFTGLERRHAERTIKDSWPNAWEAISRPFSVQANPRRRTAAPSRRNMPMTGSWSPRSHRIIGKASSRSSPHPAASAGREPKSAASLCPRPNTRSAASASSSMRIATSSMPDRRASSAGGGGIHHDDRTRPVR